MHSSYIWHVGLKVYKSVGQHVYLSTLVFAYGLIQYLLAHLSQSDMVSFCDRFSSAVCPSVVGKLLL
jgi:hypothetical protein